MQTDLSKHSLPNKQLARFAPVAAIQAAVVVEAPPSVVWQTFRQIDLWPRWYPGVLAATWQTDPPWQAGSRMQIQVQNSLGLPMQSVATVQPTSDAGLLWENRGTGLVTLCQAEVWPVEQGARFLLHKQYSGPTVWLLRLLKARQVTMLQQGLTNLKQLIEQTDSNPSGWYAAHDPDQL